MTAENDCSALRARLDALEKMLTEREDRTKERFESINRATTLARESMEKRLDGMNEFRDTLKDQASAFIPRSEFTRVIADLNHMADRYLPRDVYEVQHAQVWKQVEINTQRLYDAEKFISTMTNVKEEKSKTLGSTYYAVAIGGVLFAVLTSLVTVVFNIWTFRR